MYSIGNTDAQVEHDMHTVADLCLDELGALDAYIVDTEERKKAVWSARSGKGTSRLTEDFGRGSSFSTASVMTASVPSAPMSRSLSA